MLSERELEDDLTSAQAVGFRRRVFAVTFIGLTALLLQARPAHATFTENEIGCRASAIIRDEDGKTTRVNAQDAKATLPREGTVRWTGSTAEPVHNHSGEIGLDLGLDTVPIESWGSANNKDETAKSDREEIPAVLKYLPPGKYLIAGSHSGDEGSCAGEIEVTLEGGTIDTVWKVGGVALTVLMGLGLISAGRPRG